MKDYLYSSIKLSSNLDNYIDTDGTKLESIDELSLINIFVGSNNSGKSRFLRELFKCREYIFNSKNPDTYTFLEFIRCLSQELFELKNSEYAKNIIALEVPGVGILNEDDFRQLEIDFFDFSSDFTSFKRVLNAIPQIFVSRVTSNRGSHNLVVFRDQITAFGQRNKEKIDFIKSFQIEKRNEQRFYIPILRSLNNFQNEATGVNPKEKHESKDFLKERVRSTYDLGNFQEISDSIFTGQHLYFDVRSMLLGEKSKRDIIGRYELFLSQKLFSGKNISLIPREDSDVLFVNIDGIEREIYNLGDGIQALIALTYPIFAHENALFFIEEPETHLHPGMQRKFLELLLELKNEKNHQYFITTHSNHFLDLTFDHDNVSIYKFFSKDGLDKKTVEQVNSGDETVLKELGVKNSSVFLTNATIWIEGITDRLYIKKFLELYQNGTNVERRIFEDSDYSFVEYGGNNITHWSFLESQDPTIYIERLCGKAYLITDKDTGKEERQKKLKEKLGIDRYKCLSCLEIENILSLKTIERVIKSYPRDSAFTLPSSITGYPHKKIPFGTFIEQNLKSVNNKYADTSGSLLATKKLEFCRRAIDGMTYNEMTPLAKNLAKGIYDFVLVQNQ